MMIDIDDHQLCILPWRITCEFSQFWKSIKWQQMCSLANLKIFNL